MTILSINTGSSSLKFALYQFENDQEQLLAEGAVERIGMSGGHLSLRDAGKKMLVDVRDDFPEHKTAVYSALAAGQSLRLPQPVAVGHRLVHGGQEHTAPTRVDTDLLKQLWKLVAFAPLHLPQALAAIRAVTSRFPDLPQVACFDTAFHRRMPEVAQRFPFPRDLWDIGLRRYGFHGLSYEYIMTTLEAKAQGRIIIAHLGNGVSLAAVRDGQALDTTMGFTPTGGMMMGTRSGDLDPGVLLYLMNEHEYNAARLDHLVNVESGLKGVSGISSDMKTLLEQEDSNPHAAQAVDMFCYQLRKQIGALTAVLGGLDMLVFTGGIGERAAPIRQRVCQGLEYLGIDLDPVLNDSHAEIITTETSSCSVRVIPTNEDLMIARHTYRTVSAARDVALTV